MKRLALSRRDWSRMALAGASGLALGGCGRDDGIPRHRLPAPPVPLPAPPQPRPDALFPLQVKAGTRHLLDAQARPFLLQGDSAWSLLAQLRRDDIDHYLADRQARGYNAVLVNLIESHFCDRPPFNSEGIAPFRSPATFDSIAQYLRRVDFETPNPAYLELFDHLLDRADQHGMVVLAAPCYAGYAGGEQGWWSAMKRNGAQKLQSWGRFLGDRYRSRHNLIWVQGGDYNVPDRSLVHALADGIREYDPAKLQTFHGGRGTGAHDWMGGSAWLGLGNIYTGAVVEDAALRYRASHGRVPFILFEAFYENYFAAPRDPRLTRAQAYQALLSGACGQLSGHDDIWQFRPSWRAALGAGTSRSMAQLARVFGPLPWWTFEPDAGRLLVGDRGTGLDRAVAAVSADSSLALVYWPQLRPLEIGAHALGSRSLSATWIDPAVGRRVNAATAASSGDRWTFEPPGPNAAAATDWLLLLRTSGERDSTD